MAVSAAESPTSPDIPVAGGDQGDDTRLRASDAERDEAAGELGEHFAAGRLSHDTFMRRMNTALRARHRSDLPPLLADLPPRGRPRGWLAARWEAAGAMVSHALRALPSGLGSEARPSRPGPRLPREARIPREAGGAVPPSLRPPRARRVMPPPVLPFPRGAGTTFTIGRDRECDLAVDDMTVSRVHARLERTTEGWLLTDLGSTNGTRLNGWRVRDAVLVRAGDVVRFGETEYAMAGQAEGGPGEAGRGEAGRGEAGPGV